MTAISDARATDHVAALLRERIYGGIACLSTLLVLVRVPGPEPSAWTILLDVAVATGSLWAASLLADVVSHLGAHGSVPRGLAMMGVLRASGQILEAAIVPALLLVLAGTGALAVGTAMWAAVWVSVATLGLFALLSVRRTELSWWKRGLFVVLLVGLGALVVAAKTLAH